MDDLLDSSTEQMPASAAHLLILARDPRVIAAARGAGDRLGRATALVRSVQEALSLLRSRDSGPFHLICEPEAAGLAWPHLLAVAAEWGNRSALVIVSAQPGVLPPGLMPLPPDAVRLTAALGVAGASQPPPPRDTRRALRAVLTRGDITVHYQPVVRIADRRPMMVEALVRWQAQLPPIAPEHFVALAEGAGLGKPLALAVASRAVAEISAVRRHLRLGLSINLSLGVLLQPDLLAWLRRAMGRSGLRPGDIALELTETTPVRDRAALYRALSRLRAAGHPVLLDDMLANDPRIALMDLPFTGIKLDRSLVESLPDKARSRLEVRRLARGAAARGQRIIAEGVADARSLPLLRSLGVSFAQGYLISRPMPAAALPAWSTSWRAGRAG